MLIKKKYSGSNYNSDSSDCESNSVYSSDQKKFKLLNEVIESNENYVQYLESLLKEIDESIRVNNIKLEVYDLIKKKRKNHYKKRFWYDAIEFYEYDDLADKIPEVLRVLKMINIQNNKKNMSSFLTKIIEEMECEESFLDEEAIKMDDQYERNEDNLIEEQKKNKKVIFNAQIENFVNNLEEKNAKDYDWINLAKKLNTKHNTKFTGLEIFQAYMIKKDKFIKNEKWSKDEDEIMCKAIQIHGTDDWKQIANYLDGKDTANCFQRWYKHVNKNIKKGRWSLFEDMKLAIYLEHFGKNKWALIAKKFNNRTDVQIRERWCNILDPNLKVDNKWKVEEDKLLLKLADEMNKKWTKIKTYFDGRTDNQCSRRYNRLISKTISVKNPPEISQQDQLIINAIKAKKNIFSIKIKKRKEKEI